MVFARRFVKVLFEEPLGEFRNKPSKGPLQAHRISSSIVSLELGGHSSVQLGVAKKQLFGNLEENC